MMFSNSIHLPANDNISFFFMALAESVDGDEDGWALLDLRNTKNGWYHSAKGPRGSCFSDAG
jgi:hypothetical protein